MGMEASGNYQYRYASNGTEMILEANPDKHGIVSLIRPELSDNLVQPNIFLMNLYRLNSSGVFRGLARSEPFTVTEPDSRTITLHFGETEVHPLQMQATYTVHNENVIDLDLSLKSAQALSKYEVFVSSYFHHAVQPHAVIPHWPGKTADEDMLLYKLEDQPFYKGHYIYLPRDDRAVHSFFDGRWHDNNGARIIEMVAGPSYGKPLAVMTNDDLTIIQMAAPDECAGILITYASTDKDDDINHHNACYFSLIGDDLSVGEQRHARMRQVIRTGRLGLQEIMQEYDHFLDNLK